MRRTFQLAVFWLVLGTLAAQELPTEPAPNASTAAALPIEAQPAATTAAFIAPDALPAPDGAATAAATAAVEAAGLGRAVSSTYLPASAFGLVSIPQEREPQPADIMPSAGGGDLLPSTLLLPPTQALDPLVAPTAIVTPPADYKANLDQHNAYRARHQSTPAMGWDDQVAASALAYAQKCIWAHDAANTAYGENLYAFSLYSDAMRVQYQLDGLKAWYDEISLYNYNNPVFSSGTGHFTQMVWRSSTALGCAFMNCPTLTGWAPGRFYMVCRYKPSGNWRGEFATNVMPLIGSTPTPPPSTAATVVQANVVIAQSGSTSTDLAAGPNCRFSPNGLWSVCVRHATGRWELMQTGSTSFTWAGTNSWTPTFITNNRPFKLQLDSTGRISILSKTNSRLGSWTSSNLGVAPYRFEIRDDGKLRVVDSRNVVIWERPSA